MYCQLLLFICPITSIIINFIIFNVINFIKNNVFFTLEPLDEIKQEEESDTDIETEYLSIECFEDDDNKRERKGNKLYYYYYSDPHVRRFAHLNLLSYYN